MADYAESGKHPGPLPTPGVYARHNANDTPALLPDGSISELSISRTLRARGSMKGALANDINETIRMLDPEAEPPEAEPPEGDEDDAETDTAPEGSADNEEGKEE